MGGGFLCCALAQDDPRLTAPFAVARPSFFHAALEVPPLESAVALEPGDALLRLRSTHARSRHEETIDGQHDEFDGMYHEWLAPELRYGLFDGFEIGGRAVLAGWDEQMDDFHLVDEDGDRLVRDENVPGSSGGASSRHVNVSVIGLAAKMELASARDAGADFAALLSAKLPVGRARDLTNAGTYDVALTMLASVPLGADAIHVNLGATVPLGAQDLFEPQADVDLAPFVHGGVAWVHAFSADLAAGVQLEANTSAFTDVDFLDRPAATLSASVRRIWGACALEVGVGSGLDWSSSYRSMFFASLTFAL